MVVLYINEEYDYRDWIAHLSDAEYQDLLSRWATMRGLHACVPVTLIVPQAVELTEVPCLRSLGITHRCHIHEWDDSWLDGSDYEIPEDTDFWMNGVKIQR